MENFPSPEGAIEEIKKEAVLEELRAHGFEDPKTRELVLRWTEQQEARVTAENASRAAIVFNVDRADLYVAAGDLEGALGCLDHALYQARQENERELYDQILKKIEEIETTL